MGSKKDNKSNPAETSSADEEEEKLTWDELAQELILQNVPIGDV